MEIAKLILMSLSPSRKYLTKAPTPLSRYEDREALGWTVDAASSGVESGPASLDADSTPGTASHVPGVKLLTGSLYLLRCRIT